MRPAIGWGPFLVLAPATPAEGRHLNQWQAEYLVENSTVGSAVLRGLYAETQKARKPGGTGRASFLQKVL